MVFYDEIAIGLPRDSPESHLRAQFVWFFIMKSRLASPETPQRSPQELILYGFLQGDHHWLPQKLPRESLESSFCMVFYNEITIGLSRGTQRVT